MTTKKDFLYLLIISISIFLIYSGWSMRPLGCDEKSSVKIIKAASKIKDYSEKIAIALVSIIFLTFLIMTAKPSFIANRIDYVKNKTNADLFDTYLILIILLIVCLVSWYITNDIIEKISEKADDFSDDVEYLSFISLLYSCIGVFCISLIFGLELFPTLVKITDDWKQSILKGGSIVRKSNPIITPIESPSEKKYELTPSLTL